MKRYDNDYEDGGDIVAPQAAKMLEALRP